MIEGKQIRLRAIEKEDLPQLVEWLNCPEVRDNLAVYTPFSMTAEEDWFNMVMKAPLEEHPLCIEVKTKNGWKLIGDTSFIHYDAHNRNTEFGLFIGDNKYWDKGYGCMATRLMLRYGFNYLNLNRIYLHVFETNPRAIKCYQKAGYIEEGKARQAYFQNGKYINTFIMSVLRDEWTDEEI